MVVFIGEWQEKVNRNHLVPEMEVSVFSTSSILASMWSPFYSKFGDELQFFYVQYSQLKIAAIKLGRSML